MTSSKSCYLVKWKMEGDNGCRGQAGGHVSWWWGTDQSIHIDHFGVCRLGTAEIWTFCLVTCETAETEICTRSTAARQLLCCLPTLCLLWLANLCPNSLEECGEHPHLNQHLPSPVSLVCKEMVSPLLVVNVVMPPQEEDQLENMKYRYKYQTRLLFISGNIRPM